MARLLTGRSRGSFLCLRGRSRNQAAGKAAFAVALYVDIADNAEHQRADEVDEHVLHRVVKPDVKMPEIMMGILLFVGSRLTLEKALKTVSFCMSVWKI